MFVIGATRSRSPLMPVPEPFGQGVGRFSLTSEASTPSASPGRRRGGRLRRGGRAAATRSLSRAVGRLAMTTPSAMPARELGPVSIAQGSHVHYASTTVCAIHADSATGKAGARSGSN
jgi:hypothetical protein